MGILSWPDWVCWTVGGVVALAGACVFIWAMWGDRSRGRRRCGGVRGCWYDMSATPGLTCPECGRTARSERKLFRSRRRWKTAGAMVVVLIAGGAVAGVPAWWSGAWVRWAPSTVLIWALPRVEERQAHAIYVEVAARTCGGAGRVRWIRREGLWDWQWRMLARTYAGLVASSDPTNPNVHTRWKYDLGTSALYYSCLYPEAAVDELLVCLRHSDAFVRGAAEAMLREMKYDLADRRGDVLAALKANALSAADAGTRENIRRDIALVERAQSIQADERSSISPTPDELLACVQRRDERALAVMRRRCGPSMLQTSEPRMLSLVRPVIDLATADSGSRCRVAEFQSDDDSEREVFVWVGNPRKWMFALHFEIRRLFISFEQLQYKTVISPSGKWWLVIRVPRSLDSIPSTSEESWILLGDGAASAREALLYQPSGVDEASLFNPSAITSVLEWGLTSSELTASEEKGRLILTHSSQLAYVANWDTSWPKLSASEASEFPQFIHVWPAATRYTEDAEGMLNLEPGSPLWAHMVEFDFASTHLVDLDQSSIDHLVSAVKGAKPTLRHWFEQVARSGYSPALTKAIDDALAHEPVAK